MVASYIVDSALAVDMGDIQFVCYVVEETTLCNSLLAEMLSSAATL